MIPFYSAWKTRNQVMKSISEEIGSSPDLMDRLGAWHSKESDLDERIDAALVELRKEFGVLGELSRMSDLERAISESRSDGEISYHKSLLRTERQRIEDKVKRLRKLFLPDLKRVPNYSPLFVGSVYRFLRGTLGDECLGRVRYTGEMDQLKEHAKDKGILVVMNHQSMEDPLYAALPFLESGRRIPMMHSGANLYSGWNAWMIQLGNAMMVNRPKKGISSIEMAKNTYLYAKMIEHFPHETHVVYGQGTRSRDGLIGPMKKGFIRAFLRSYRKQGAPVGWCTASVTHGYNTDFRDYTLEKKTGKSSSYSINTILRNLKPRIPLMTHPDSGVYVNISRIRFFPKNVLMTSSLTPIVNFYAAKIRSSLLDNMTVLPESLMALSYERFDKEGMNDSPAEMREMYLKHAFLKFAHHALKKGVPVAQVISDDIERAFDAGSWLYRKMGMVSDDGLVKVGLPVTYNANAVRHHFDDMKDWSKNRSFIGRFSMRRYQA